MCCKWVTARSGAAGPLPPSRSERWRRSADCTGFDLDIGSVGAVAWRQAERAMIRRTWRRPYGRRWRAGPAALPDLRTVQPADEPEGLRGPRRDRRRRAPARSRRLLQVDPRHAQPSAVRRSRLAGAPVRQAVRDRADGRRPVRGLRGVAGGARGDGPGHPRMDRSAYRGLAARAADLDQRRRRHHADAAALAPREPPVQPPDPSPRPADDAAVPDGARHRLDRPAVDGRPVSLRRRSTASELSRAALLSRLLPQVIRRGNLPVLVPGLGP